MAAAEMVSGVAAEVSALAPVPRMMEATIRPKILPNFTTASVLYRTRSLAPNLGLTSLNILACELFDQRNRADPAGAGAVDLDREAAQREAVRGQCGQVHSSASRICLAQAST